MPIGSIVNSIGGLIGGHYDREFARAQSEADRAFQREVFQNQYQWKAADAKKAGLHPLAVIGGGSYSASPSSQPSSSSMASVLGKLGEGIGDAVTAYMNKDEIAEQKAKEEAEWNKKMELLGAQIDEIRARTSSYSVPMASGRETISGQTDANPAKPLQDNVFGSKSYPLFNIAKHGDILLTALNPDIADSLTESQAAHLSAVGARELEAGRNPRILHDALKHLPKQDQKAVADGRAVLDYVPGVGGYVLTYRKTYHRRKDGSAYAVSGALRF